MRHPSFSVKAARSMSQTKWSMLPVLGAGLFLFPAAPAKANTHAEKHFTVQGRPVVVIQNVGNGRIEVKSWKNQEIVVSSTQASNKILVESEQVGDRVDVTS